MTSNAAGTMFVALMAAITVSLWTARVALAAAGRKLATAMVAAVEALTFVLVFQQIASNLDAIDRLVGYAVGVAAGTLAGLYMNDRLSSGQSSIQVIAPGDRPLLGPTLHELGWPASMQSAIGPRGAITTLVLVVDNARLADALDDVRRIAVGWFRRRVPPTSCRSSATAAGPAPGWASPAWAGPDPAYSPPSSFLSTITETLRIVASLTAASIFAVGGWSPALDC